MVRHTWVVTIACLYVASAAITSVDAHHKKDEECMEKQKQFQKKEEECWKKKCPDKPIPPAIECSLAKQISMELVLILNVLVQANVTQTMPRKFGPILTLEDKKAIFKCLADAALSLKVGADKAGKAKDVTDQEDDDDDFALLNILAAAADVAVKMHDNGALPVGPGGKLPLPVPGGQLPVPGGKLPLPVPGGQLPVPGGQLPLPVPGGKLPLPVPGGKLPLPVPGGGLPVPPLVPPPIKTVLDLQAFLQKEISLDIDGNLFSKYVEMISTLTMEEKSRMGPARSTILHITRCTGLPENYLEDHDPSVETLFFPTTQLKVGGKLTLEFAKSINTAPFFDISGIAGGMPGTIAASLLIDLLVAALSPLGSLDLGLDTNAINLCDTSAGKSPCPLACATDLEAMLKFITTQLGGGGEEEVDPCNACPTAPEKKMEYTITGFKKIPDLQSVGCAKMVCPVALYMCQHLPKAISYTVSLEAADGTKIETPCMCHEDTKSWNAESWIFKTLNTKPGECGVCHFLASDDIAWMPKGKLTVPPVV